MKKEDVIMKEIKKDLNLKERAWVHLFKNIVIKVFVNGVKKGYNWENKK